MPRLSPQQKAARRLGIGSSDVAELLGISPYEGASPVRLFAEKTGLLPNDDEDEETIEQRVGHALEGALVKLYESESGFRVHVSGEFVESVSHPEHEWRRANLDGRVDGKRAALEIKVVGIGMASDWDKDADDGIPHYVRVQVAWQMHVADLDEVHVVALIGGTGFRVFYVLRDFELEAMLVREAETFWINTSKMIAPPLDATSSCKAYLESLYPSPAKDVEVEIVDELEIGVGERRLRAENARSRADEAKELASNELREVMGKHGATVAWCSSWRATWRTAKNGVRSLRIEGRGELKEPKSRGPKANSKRPPVIEDGEVF